MSARRSPHMISKTSREIFQRAVVLGQLVVVATDQEADLVVAGELLVRRVIDEGGRGVTQDVDVVDARRRTATSTQVLVASRIQPITVSALSAGSALPYCAHRSGFEHVRQTDPRLAESMLDA